jgi:hypothetical protein
LTAQPRNLSDIFTDVTYVLVARDTTWFARLTLAARRRARRSSHR